MGQRISVAKAASLLGIRRADLQRLIRNGTLQAFEGQLSLDSLRAHFPSLALAQSPIVERVAHLRESAFARRVRSEVVVQRDTLEHQLKCSNADLAVARGEAAKYRSILEDFAKLLSELQDTDDEGQRETAQRLSRWLLARLGG